MLAAAEARRSTDAVSVPPPAPSELRILPVRGIGEIRPGDDLAGIIADACDADPATRSPTATSSS